jgi:tripartite-type tricarboxylate transporter receptor subunit TctC
MILPGRTKDWWEHAMKKLIVAAAAMLAIVTSAGAEDFPSRPITMIVPFAAGGPTDVLGRIMAEGMRASLGQSVIIENATGAAGSIGVGKAVRAAPDGYTLSIGHWSTHVINGAIYKLPYDLLTDLEPVSLLSSNPQLIVANIKVPADDLKSLVAWIKANPDKVAAGTAGPGSASHVGGIYLQRFSDTKFLFVPYRGTGPAMQDLIGGQIQLMLDQSSNSLPQVRNKQIKAFAVTAKTRLAAAPDIPTVDEVGMPGF